MRLARAEHEADVVVGRHRAAALQQLVDEPGAAVLRHHHDPLPDREHAVRHLVEERGEAVLVDLTRREAVGTPAESGRPHDVVPVTGEEDPALLVLLLDEAPSDVIRALLIAAHLLDVDRVPESVDRFLLVLGIGPAHDERHE